jgi:hypothetical protein
MCPFVHLLRQASVGNPQHFLISAALAVSRSPRLFSASNTPSNCALSSASKMHATTVNELKQTHTVYRYIVAISTDMRHALTTSTLPT